MANDAADLLRLAIKRKSWVLAGAALELLEEVQPESRVSNTTSRQKSGKQKKVKPILPPEELEELVEVLKEEKAAPAKRGKSKITQGHDLREDIPPRGEEDGEDDDEEDEADEKDTLSRKTYREPNTLNEFVEAECSRCGTTYTAPRFELNRRFSGEEVPNVCIKCIRKIAGK